MNVQVKLYGNLKKKTDVEDHGAGIPTVITKELNEHSKIIDLLNALNLSPDEVSHKFVNGQYSGLKKNIYDGDKIAIFPKDMALLYKWYFNEEEDE
jgi:molybdopterin converting factor small subunit